MSDVLRPAKLVDHACTKLLWITHKRGSQLARKERLGSRCFNHGFLQWIVIQCTTGGGGTARVFNGESQSCLSSARPVGMACSPHGHPANKHSCAQCPRTTSHNSGEATLRWTMRWAPPHAGHSLQIRSCFRGGSSVENIIQQRLGVAKQQRAAPRQRRNPFMNTQPPHNADTPNLGLTPMHVYTGIEEFQCVCPSTTTKYPTNNG